MNKKFDWKKYYKEHKEERLSQSKIYYAKNKEKVKAKSKIYSKNNSGKILERNRRYKYKLTDEKLNEMLKKQDYKCVCGTDISKPNSYAVDHDHSCCSSKKTCGKCIRGLLCKNCNFALGYVKDNPQTLLKLTKYLYDLKPTRSSNSLISFMLYSIENESERFWQALRNWSKVPFILIAKSLNFNTGKFEGIEDTFYVEK